MENGHLSWIFPLKVVISHRYITLPEGQCKGMSVSCFLHRCDWNLASKPRMSVLSAGYTGAKCTLHSSQQTTLQQIRFAITTLATLKGASQIQYSNTVLQFRQTQWRVSNIGRFSKPATSVCVCVRAILVYLDIMQVRSRHVPFGNLT